MGIGHFRTSTPTAGLQAITNCPPLELIIQKTGIAIHNRIKNTVKRIWDGLGKQNQRGHMTYWDNFTKSNGLRLGTSDNSIKRYMWKKPVPYISDNDNVPNRILRSKSLKGLFALLIYQIQQN